MITRIIESIIEVTLFPLLIVIYEVARLSWEYDQDEGKLYRDISPDEIYLDEKNQERLWKEYEDKRK